jgi:DNA-binding GntR family transcriptional regulator
LLNDRPVEIAESWYPSAIAQGTPLAEPRKIKGGAVSALAAMGYTPRHVREDVSAHPATQDEAESLGLAEGEPVLVLFRTVLTANDEPFEATVMTMATEGRHLRYELTV